MTRKKKAFEDMTTSERLEYGITDKFTGKMRGMLGYGTYKGMNEGCRAMAENPETVCSECYVDDAMARCPSLKTKYERNTITIANELIAPEDFPRINALYFRYEPFGDLVNTVHARNYIVWAEQNPLTNFGWWTKRPEIIETAMKLYGIGKPDNVTIVYSYPLKKVNPADIPQIVKRIKARYPFIDKVFFSLEKDFMIEHGIKSNCAAVNCFHECGCKCYRKDSGQDVIFEVVRPRKTKKH